MAKPIIMPRQGQSVESCIIGEWHVKKGDQVKEGDKLFTYETDKATFDEMAPEDGQVIAVFFDEGDDVPCLLNVCVLGADGDDWTSFIPAGATLDGAGEQGAAPAAGAVPAPAETAAAATETAAKAAAEQAAPAAAAVREGDLVISPRARAAAEKHHVDLRLTAASGPKNRVIERDVLAALAAGHIATAAAGSAYDPAVQGTGIGGSVRVEDLTAQPVAAAPAESFAVIDAAAGPEYEDKKLSNIRKVIARSMHASISEMAQLTLNTSFDASNILAFRKRLKALQEQNMGEKLGLAILQRVPTINDIILYAVSRVIRNHPECNAHFLGDSMRYYNRVHLGVAVDTPRGLMVPVVRNADLKTISAISAEAKDLATQCLGGTINPDHLSGSTITITNLGTLGIEHFTPVNNPPETCILGVSTIVERVRTVKGDIQVYPAMNLSLTIDHRAVDGAPGARFLQDLVKALEHFDLFLMG